MARFTALTMALLCALGLMVEAEEKPKVPRFLLSATADDPEVPENQEVSEPQALGEGGSLIIPIDVTSAESWDLQDDPSNMIMLVDLGPGTVMTGIGWEVTIATVGTSKLSEAVVHFDGQDLDGVGLYLTPGFASDNSGIGTFESRGEILDLTDVGIADIPIGTDGQLYLQFFEWLDDVGDAVDATWDDGAGSSSSTLLIQVEGRPFLTIPTEFPAVSGTPVDVPVELDTSGRDLASIAFSVDYDETCLSFDPTDSDGNGIPDAINIPLPPTFSRTVTTDLSDIDGELDFALFANDPQTTIFTDGTVATITFTATCSSGPLDTVIAPVAFSSDPMPTFDDPNAVAISGNGVDGLVEIFSGVRGDCDADGVVNAPDMNACQLESFDGDGNIWTDTLDVVPFSGGPVGCDANADTLVDAGDLSCMARLISGLPCATSPAEPSESPRLSLQGELPTSSDEVVVEVFFEPGELVINSLMFSLDYDESRLVYDGLPGAFRFLGRLSSMESITFDANDTDGELDIVISDLDTTQGSSGGLIFEVSLRLLEPGPDSIAGGVKFSVEPRASFGDIEGRSVPGSAEVESQPFFADGFESGDLSAWEKAVP